VSFLRTNNALGTVPGGKEIDRGHAVYGKVVREGEGGEMNMDLLDVIDIYMHIYR
jgi:hypothetical protein